MVLLVLKVFKNIFKLGIKCKYYILFEIILLMFCFWLKYKKYVCKIMLICKGCSVKKVSEKKERSFFCCCVCVMF